MFFSKYIFFVLDQIKIIWFAAQAQTVGSYIKSIRNILLDFKNAPFQNEYLFHWRRYRKVHSLSTEPINRNNAALKLNLSASRLNKTQIPHIAFVESWTKYLRSFSTVITDLTSKTFSFGFYYLRGFAFLLFIDACLTDDEPLWEPIEWSLVQTWILFIFCFAWISLASSCWLLSAPRFCQGLVFLWIYIPGT